MRALVAIPSARAIQIPPPAMTDELPVNSESASSNTVSASAASPPPVASALLLRKTDWWIVSQIAKRCGFPGFDYDSAADVFKEL